MLNDVGQRQNRLREEIAGNVLVFPNIYILSAVRCLVNGNDILYNQGMKRSETIQNYLEAIHIISLKKDVVKAIDVAEYCGFSRPTVSVALKELENEGYIHVENYHILLTPKGKKEAKKMYERHEYIAKLLMKLGVDEKTAYEDSCLVEHDISVRSFNAIKKATKHLFEE